MTGENAATGAITCLFIAAIAWIMVGVVRWAAERGDVNAAMGIRLPSLMESPRAWAAGARAAVPAFGWTAVLSSTASVLAAAAALLRAETLFLALLVVACVALALGGVLGILVAHRAAGRATDR